MIVLTRPAQTDSRLVRKLAHAQHHAAPPKRRQNNVKIGQKRYRTEDRSGPALIIHQCCRLGIVDQVDFELRHVIKVDVELCTDMYVSSPFKVSMC